MTEDSRARGSKAAALDERFEDGGGVSMTRTPGLCRQDPDGFAPMDDVAGCPSPWVQNPGLERRTSLKGLELRTFGAMTPLRSTPSLGFVFSARRFSAGRRTGEDWRIDHVQH